MLSWLGAINVTRTPGFVTVKALARTIRPRSPVEGGGSFLATGGRGTPGGGFMPRVARADVRRAFARWALR
jgi:hypothetical protein